MWALLELYKQGEATWEQDEPFGDITVVARTVEPAQEVASSELARILEALLFLSNEPVVAGGPGRGDRRLARRGGRGDGRAAGRPTRPASAACSSQVAGGYTLATDPDAEAAARKLLAKPRTPPLTPAQAEALAIVAYLQPVSRPEMARIRGVSSDSATTTLVERGLIEESGRSQFGAVLYRTTPLFLKLFGLGSLDDLPDASTWDPTPEEEADLRDRLLRAGEQRAGIATPTE